MCGKKLKMNHIITLVADLLVYNHNWGMKFDCKYVIIWQA